MAESLNQPELEQELNQEFPLPEVNQPADGPKTPNRAVVLGATGLAAIAGISAEAATANAAPASQTNAAHVQAVGEQQISTGDFLKTAKVSAAELLKLRASNGVTTKAEKSGNYDPEEYTKNYFEGMRNGSNLFGYFNGNVILNNKTKIYACLDPSLNYVKKTPQGNYSCKLGYPSLYASTKTKNKFGAGYRPAVLIDNKNQPWLAFTLESGGYRLSGGFGSSGQTDTEPYPAAQLDTSFFVPLKGNEHNLQFFLSSPGQPTFLAGGVITYNPKNAQDLSEGNFICTTPGFQNESSDYLAEWTTAVRDGNHFSNGSVFAPAFAPNSALASYTHNPATHKSWKKYQMPSGKALKSIMKKIHNSYQGTD